MNVECFSNITSIIIETRILSLIPRTDGRVSIVKKVFQYMSDVGELKDGRFCALLLAEDLTDLDVMKIVILPTFQKISGGFEDFVNRFIVHYEDRWGDKLPRLDVHIIQRMIKIRKLIDDNGGGIMSSDALRRAMPSSISGETQDTWISCYEFNISQQFSFKCRVHACPDLKQLKFPVVPKKRNKQVVVVMSTYTAERMENLHALKRKFDANGKTATQSGPYSVVEDQSCDFIYALFGGFK